MKKFLFLVLALALLAGCSAKSSPQVQPRGTAEIVMRDGQKWVHVLGTGVEFPLLGEWVVAKEHINDVGNTYYGMFAYDDSASLIVVGGPHDIGETFSEAVYAGEVSFKEAGVELCENQKMKYADAGLVTSYIFSIHCTGNGWHALDYYVETEKDGCQVSIRYRGMDAAHRLNSHDFEEMMRRVEVH